MVTKNKFSKRKIIVKNQNKNLTIKQLLFKIWNNIQILRYLAGVSTVLAFILGVNDIYDIIHDKLTILQIKSLKNTSLQLNNGNTEFNRNWINDVEKLKDESKFVNDYYLLKGLGITVSNKNNDPLFNTELSAEYYLKMIPVESKNFDEALILKVANIQLIKSDSIRILGLRNLVNELDLINYKTPRYFFVKYSIANAESSLDTLISNYKELNERFFDNTKYNRELINDVIKKGGKTQWELTQIQTLEYLYNLTIANTIRYYREKKILPENIENINLNALEIKCINYLKRINTLPDEQLDFLRGGFDAFMLSNPLFSLSMHVQYFDNDSQWFNYQRFYLKQFIDNNIYIRFWGQ